MNPYFSLQFKRSSRKLAEFGIHPWVGFILISAGFILLSEFAFFKTQYAKYGLLLVALSILLNLSQKQRSEFLMLIFDARKFRQIRLIENILVSLPFLTILSYHLAFPEAIRLVISSVLLSFLSFGKSSSFTLPTPFSKHPFEFPVGFRKTFLLFPIAYLLTFLAISVGNFSLGIFSLLLVFLIPLSYYSTPEDEYYVWIFSSTPSQFLKKKIRTASVFITFLMILPAIALCISYSSQMYIILLIALAGYLFLWTIILAKYTAYPNEMNLPEAIPIALSLFFPPALLLLIPYFYSKAIKNLNQFLHDSNQSAE